jgi:hypothetical protein
MAKTSTAPKQLKKNDAGQTVNDAGQPVNAEGERTLPADPTHERQTPAEKHHAENVLKTPPGEVIP